MGQDVFTEWPASASEGFGKENLVLRHNVHQRDMFTDEGLAELLDRYPRDQLHIYTMGDNPEQRTTFRKGAVGNLPGADILEIIKTGRFWVNLRAANNDLPEYAALSDDLFGAVEAQVGGGLKTRKRDVGVLISSPNAQVFYHLDVPLVLLWQIRGTKRVWIYPPEAPYVSDQDLEKVVLRETEEEFDFDPAYDEGAFCIDLEPGMLATWPQNAPHRIANHGMMNVSLSCEFMTLKALIRANALYANGVLRRSANLDPSITRDGLVKQTCKASLARVFKALNSRKVFERHIPVTFHVDPDVEGAMRDVPVAA